MKEKLKNENIIDILSSDKFISEWQEHSGNNDISGNENSIQIEDVDTNYVVDKHLSENWF